MITLKNRIVALDNAELRIHMGADCVLDEHWHSEGVQSPFTRLYFVKEGDGFLEHRGRRIPLRGGNVYLIPSECRFSFGCTSLKKLFFHITLPAAEQYDLFCNLDQILQLPCPKERIDTLCAYFASEQYGDLLKLKTELWQTAISFVEQFRLISVPIKEYSQAVSLTVAHIQRNASLQLSVKELAQKVLLSQSGLRNAFKKEVGVTIGAYIDHTVLTRAKQLLTEDAASLAQIATALGFCDQFYFSRRFKEKCGMTPSEFRRRHRVGLVT